jgi:hypothetical protein
MISNSFRICFFGISNQPWRLFPAVSTTARSFNPTSSLSFSLRLLSWRFLFHFDGTHESGGLTVLRVWYTDFGYCSCCSMPQLPLILSRFSICTDNVDPDVCTSEIGIVPTEVLKKGRSRVHPRPPEPENSWSVETERRTMYSVDESIAELLTILWPKKDQIIALCHKCEAECLFVTAVYANDEYRPVYDISRMSLKRMADLSASWIMDLV